MSQCIHEIIYNTVTKQFIFNVEKDISPTPIEDHPNHTMISLIRYDDGSWYVNEHRDHSSTSKPEYIWTKCHKMTELPPEMKAMELLVFH